MTSPRYEIFFDRSCPLCSTEMKHLKRLDRRDAFEMIDCSDASFDPAAYGCAAVGQDAMMQRLHIRDDQGRMIVGVDAFGVLYREAGLPLLAALWSSRWTRPFSSRFYTLLARHRQAISRRWLDRLLDFTLHRLYLRAMRSSAAQVAGEPRS